MEVWRSTPRKIIVRCGLIEFTLKLTFFSEDLASTTTSSSPAVQEEKESVSRAVRGGKWVEI